MTSIRWTKYFFNNVIIIIIIMSFQKGFQISKIISE